MADTDVSTKIAIQKPGPSDLELGLTRTVTYGSSPDDEYRVINIPIDLRRRFDIRQGDELFFQPVPAVNGFLCCPIEELDEVTDE